MPVNSRFSVLLWRFFMTGREILYPLFIGFIVFLPRFPTKGLLARNFTQ